MQVARSKGSRNKPKDPSAPPKERKKRAPSANGTVHTDHNSNGISQSALTDEQKQALFFRHTKEYKKALDEKQKADADFKNRCKQIKSEGGEIAEIKLALVSPEKLESKIREQVEAYQRVSRWLGMPIGTQLSLLDEPDRQPGEEKAFNDGKRAGLAGETCDPPYAHHLPQANQWRQGWHEGQEVLSAGFKQKEDEQRQEDADDFSDLDAPPHGEQADGEHATH